MENEVEVARAKKRLERIGIYSLEDLVEAIIRLRKPDRLLGAWLLGQEGKRSVIPKLIELLHDRDEEVRLTAASSISALGGRRAVKSLIKLINSSPKNAVKEAAVYALSFCFEESAFYVLRDVYVDEENPPATRGRAAEGIAYIFENNDGDLDGFKLAVELLIKGLDDSSPEVRFWSIFALGSLRDPAALPHLRHILSTDEATLPGWKSIREETLEAITVIEAAEKKS